MNHWILILIKDFLVAFFNKNDAEIPPASPKTPPTATLPTNPIPSMPIPELIQWDTPKHIWHAVRVACDTAGLTYQQKNNLCACIFQESQFNRNAISPPNSNGTRDYGLCQFNTGVNKKTGQPYWIGPGALFSSTQDCLNHPERAAHVMIMYYKHTGTLNLWASWSTGAYKKWLPATSPMWKLAEK